MDVQDVKSNVKSSAKHAVDNVSGNTDLREGHMTHVIEQQTAKVPSIGYLNLAIGSMAISAITGLVLNKRELGNFFGLWAPCFLLVGVYNKLVKMEKHLAAEIR